MSRTAGITLDDRTLLALIRTGKLTINVPPGVGRLEILVESAYEPQEQSPTQEAYDHLHEENSFGVCRTCAQREAASKQAEPNCNICGDTGTHSAGGGWAGYGDEPCPRGCAVAAQEKYVRPGKTFAESAQLVAEVLQKAGPLMETLFPKKRPHGRS